MPIDFSKYGASRSGGQTASPTVSSSTSVSSNVPPAVSGKTDFSKYGAVSSPSASISKTAPEEKGLGLGVSNPARFLLPGGVGFYDGETIDDVKNIGSNIKQDYLDRREQAKATTEAYKSGEQGLGSTFFQAVGQGAGLVGDVAADVIKGGVKTLLPQFAENWIKKGVGAVAKPIVESDTVQSLSDKYKGFKAEHPEAGRNISAVGGIANLASNFVTIPGAGYVTKAASRVAGDVAGSTLYRTGQALLESGESAAKSSADDFFRDLVRPIRDKAVKEAEVARTTEAGWGPFKHSEVAPSEMEALAQAEVSKIPGVSKKNTYQGNYNAIEEANVQKAIDLEKTLSKPENNFYISREKVGQTLDDAAATLRESPTIVGDAHVTAERLIDGYKRILAKQEESGLGVLKARKEYDMWVRSQKPKAFDAKVENAFTEANRVIRNTANKILIENAPDALVQQSLKEQTALYHAMDNVLPKAAAEADSAVKRVFERITKVTGLRNKSIQVLAGLAGVGGLGAAATFAPFITGIAAIGGLGYGATKLILNPELRKAIGAVLREVGSQLNPADKKFIMDQLKVVGMTEAEIREATKSLKEYAGPMKQLPAPKREPRVFRSDKISDYYAPPEELPAIEFGKPGTPSAKKPVRDLPVVEGTPKVYGTPKPVTPKQRRIFKSDKISEYYTPKDKLPSIDFGEKAVPKGKRNAKGVRTIR